MIRLPQSRIVRAAVIAAGGLLAAMALTRGGPETAPVAARRAATSRGASGDAAAVLPPADLKLELLESRQAEIGEPARNPFRFQARPAPAAAARPASAAPAAPPQAAARPPAPSGPPAPPPIPLRYIGLFDAPGQAGRVAIMSDGRGNVFQGKEGDIIEGRYRLGRVGADSLELSYSDGRGRQVVRLSGQ